jgi:DNA-directed RNA polymerase specialized sigma24 family protein
MNYHRQRRPDGGGALAESAECDAPGPAEVVMAEDSRRYLWDRAAQVVSQERLTAMWLHYVEGLPTREVAAILERSSVAVKTMIFRARKKLVPLLNDLAPDRAGATSAAAPVRDGAMCFTNEGVRHV